MLVMRKLIILILAAFACHIFASAQSRQEFTADIDSLKLQGLMAHIANEGQVTESGYLVQKTSTGIDIAPTSVIILDGLIQPDVMMVFENPIKVPKDLSLEIMADFNIRLIKSDTKLVTDYSPKFTDIKVSEGVFAAKIEIEGTPAILLEYQADRSIDATHLRTIYYKGDRLLAFTCIVYDQKKYEPEVKTFMELNKLAIRSGLMWTEPHLNEKPLQ